MRSIHTYTQHYTISRNGFSHRIHSPQCTAMYIYLLGHPFCSRQRAPTTFLYAKINVFVFSAKCKRDTYRENEPNQSETSRTERASQHKMWGKLVERETEVCADRRTYRINDICHHFSRFFFVPCFPNRLSLASLLWPSFISYTQVLLCLLCYFGVYLCCLSFWFGYLADVSWYVMWLRIYRLL